ncbi:MAG: radical SAM protein [bacterium]
MNQRNWTEGYLRLDPKVTLKRLEQPYIYHIERDELYEIDEKAESFLSMCNGSAKGADLTSDADFVAYCLEEGLLEVLYHPDPITITIAHAPMPSLRYLELQLLNRCNLKCRHCYLGPARQDELSLEDAIKISGEFASIGGLRLLITGGEPLLYPHLKAFIQEISKLRLRRVLLTNGTLISEENISWLQVENIQFSLDGWRQGHDHLRGQGTFDKVLRGIRIARDAGIPISIATIIHQGNLGDFERLKLFCEEMDATEWGIDVPCVAGSLKDHPDLIVPCEKAASYMKYAYGGGYHGSSDGFACGRHLMSVLPTGRAVKCGFYENTPLGDARKSLMDCWLNLKHLPLESLECKGCPVIDDCAGGCRFRAPHPLAPDPVMCVFYGMNRD